MRLTRLAGLAGAAALAWACGDSGDSARPVPAPPTAEAEPAPAPPPTAEAEPAPAPAPTAEAAPGPSAASGGDVAAGAAHYKTYCISCHGAAGEGDGPGATDLPVVPRDFSKGEFKFDADGDGTPGEDADLRRVIAEGAAPYGGSGLMMPWGSVLDDQAIADVVAYLRSLEK